MNTDWLKEFIGASDNQLENILLCRILVSGKLPPDILSDYFTGSRELFYRSIERQWVEFKTIDPVILKKEYLENFEAALKEKGSSSSAVLDQLKRLWKKRNLAKTILKAGEKEDVDEILAQIQTETARISLKEGRGEYNHNESILRLLDLLERKQTSNNKISGYSTGLTELDKFLSGIEKGKVYCFGALKKSGKSRFAVYLSIKMREAGAGVLWDSLEMNEMQLNSLAMAYYSQVDSRNFGRTLSTPDYSNLLMSVGSLSELDWTIVSDKTVNNLRARIIELKNKRPIDVVIVDFIQRMVCSSKESRTKEVESIVIELADLSRELDVAVIELSQLSGLAERLNDDDMPNMSHMKESQAIAENADAIITLHNYDRRENPFNEDGSYRLQEIYCLIEQRYDVSGACFKFLGDLRTCNFINHSNPYEGRSKK